MKLKQHREDVKYLQNETLISRVETDRIAKRYLNIIRMAEEKLWMGPAFEHSNGVKRVLKDAGLDE